MSILASGPKVILRDRLPSDADRYVYWMGHGEWLEYDAPWENTSPLTQKRRVELRQAFIESCAGDLPCPRRRAIIADRDGRPLGWVNTYRQKYAPGALCVGICIAEDDCLNRGLGTEALRLWIAYLFANGDIERLGLETWSFNPRMKRAAEKVGLVLETVYPGEMEWQGELLDALHYYVLRSEWPAAPQEGRCER
jgi:RimJ/RimL family protein N-acetyltransferase